MPNSNRSDYVDVGFHKTGSADRNATVVTTFRAGSPSSVTQVYVHRERIRSLLIKTVPDSNGWRPTTPYRSASVKREGKPFDLRNVNKLSSINSIGGYSVPSTGSSYGYAPGNSLFFNGSGVPSVSSNTISRAETEALNKLRDASIQLGESLVELRETLGFIAEATKFLVSLITAVRRGRWDVVAQLIGVKHTHKIREAGKAWLAAKFAVQPLLGDIFGAVESFNKGMKRKDAYVHVSRQISNDVTPFFIPTSQWRNATQSGRVTELAKVVLHGRISDSFVASMSAWGLVNPFSAAWEGLGWSWLVDWIIPIGSFLNSLSGTVGLTFMGGSLTLRKVADLRYSLEPNTPNTTFVGSPCVTRIRVNATSRTTYADWPGSWPYIKNPLSGSHLSIVAALIASLRKT